MRWPIRCAVFDCDGVLLDSNPVKIAAFRAALAGEDPALVERMIAEHRQTGGVSRFAKLAWFYRELARVDSPEAAVAAALERFAVAARAGLRTCPSVPGVEIWVPELARAGVRMHVISGGEQGELREALQARDWSRHFEGIHGSPTPKHEHLERLFASGELVREGVYFGDAELDIAPNPTSKRDRLKIQAQFNAWAAETGLPYMQLSRICAMSIGENFSPERLMAMGHGNEGE